MPAVGRLWPSDDDDGDDDDDDDYDDDDGDGGDGDDHIQNPPPDLSAHVELLVKGVATTW